MHLIQIPPDVTDKVWPMVATMLERAAEHSEGKVSLPHEREYIKAQKKQLWVVHDEEQKKTVAAGVTAIKRYDTGRTGCVIELFGGENMKAWFDLKDIFEKWAKDEGCTDITFFARKGWAKHLPDYQLASYVMRKALA